MARLAPAPHQLATNRVSRISFVLLVTVLSSVAAAAEPGTAASPPELVQYKSDNPANAAGISALGIIGLHEASSTSAPQSAGGSLVLSELSVGASLPEDVPYPDFLRLTIKAAQDELYPDPALRPGDTVAAFRYKKLLYAAETRLATVAGAGSLYAELMEKVEDSQAAGNEVTLTSLPALASVQNATSETFSLQLAPAIPAEDAGALDAALELTPEEQQAVEFRKRVVERRLGMSGDAQMSLLSASSASTSTDPAADVRARYESISTWYGDNERAKVRNAVKIFQTALKYLPTNRELAHAYLDCFYDRAVAEIQYVKSYEAEKSRYRLGLEALASGDTLSKEIEILQTQILPAYDGIFAQLADLLNTRSAVDVRAAVDLNAAPGTPLGYWMFAYYQPERNPYAAQYLASDGTTLLTVPETANSASTTETRVLFNGYKDYTLMSQLLVNYANHVTELARLLAMRGSKTKTRDDVADALQQIDLLESRLRGTSYLLDGMIPEGVRISEVSGVRAAKTGLKVAISRAEDARAYITGRTNLFGFNEDFLVLARPYLPVGGTPLFDSFDALYLWMAGENSPYKVAGVLYQGAKNAYATYKGYQDQVEEKLSSAEDDYRIRYFEIVGATPDGKAEDGVTPSPYSPENPAPGSELWEAIKAVEITTSGVGTLNTLQGKLGEQVQDTQAYSDHVLPGLANQHEQFVSQHRNEVVSVHNNMTEWRAKQAAMQASFDMTAELANLSIAASDATGWLTGKGAAATVGIAAVTAMGAANIAVQFEGETAQGNGERDLATAGIDFESQLYGLEHEEKLHDAGQAVRGAERELISGSLDLHNAMGQLAQDQARVTKLRQELTWKASLMKDDVSFYGDRYYADPIHQIRAETLSIQADAAFEEAQRWTFYLMRALEFKWNKPFTINTSGVNYDSSSLYRARNFPELEKVYAAMHAFDGVNSFGFNREPFLDRISLRRDVFHFKDGERYDIYVAEKKTTESMNAVQAFRYTLRNSVTKTGNLKLDLDTFALQLPTGFFFEGPTREPDTGLVITTGKYLDKIDWLKYNLVQDGVQIPYGVSGNYSYGGTAYIRNRVPPCYDDPGSEGEYRRFPFRYFLTVDNGASWIERGTQDDTVKIQVSSTTGEPPDSEDQPIWRNTFLRERSVAATRQVLTIPKGKYNLEKMQDLEIYVRHNFVSRELPLDCSQGQ